MNAQTKKENQIKNWDRFIARRAAKTIIARRERTFLGRVIKGVRRYVGILTDAVNAKRNPGDPWDDENWMVM